MMLYAGGGDSFDQRREGHQIRRSVKWRYRNFYFLSGLVTINTFIVWQMNKRNKSLDQITFSITLVRPLIGGYTSRKRKGRPASFQAKKCVAPDDVCLHNVGNHMPKLVSNKRRCMKRNRKTQEKRTHYMCAECDVPMCTTTCFSPFHGK
ncbi:piggyBac transposable element-derived protein 4 [Trichonephila clavipes]|nr:piggyBac transposable element-derived protein 4 [Trichonephila clavipes]